MSVSPAVRPADRHELFDHVAVVHDGPDDLVEQLAGWLPASLDPSDAVLLCLGPSSTEAVRDLLVRHHAGPVTVLPPAVRYPRPGAAMRVVHDFVRDAGASGVRRAWSIGRLDVPADDDGRWARYDAAVDDVLQHLPLMGICTFDRSEVGARGVALANRTHRHVRDGGRLTSSGTYAPTALAEPRAWWIPDAAPTAEIYAADRLGARRAVVTLAMAAGCSAERADDLQLLTSELVTNAVVHGAPPAAVRMWRRPDRIVVQTVDHGPGIDDGWPDLRPPVPGAIGGLGLWLVGQLADRLHIGRRDGTTVVTAAVELG